MLYLPTPHFCRVPALGVLVIAVRQLGTAGLAVGLPDLYTPGVRVDRVSGTCEIQA